MHSFKTSVIGDVMFHLADLTKTFFLAHELKTSPVIWSMTLPHYLRYPQYHPPPSSLVTDTILEKSCKLEVSIVASLRVSVVRLTKNNEQL